MDKKSAVLLLDGAVILRRDNEVARLPFCHELPADIIENHDFTLGSSAVAGEWPRQTPLPAGFEAVELRASYAAIPHEHYRLAAKGAELLYWLSHNRWCSSCGEKMERASEISLKCPSCSREIWPSPSPAVLVLVLKGEQALLVHTKSFSRPFYGLVAGFVETGESLEEGVVREVREETGLKIKDVTYFRSQAWPFPFNLMVGFTARYDSGEIGEGDGELSDARFFSRGDCPPIPTMPSLARVIIDAWLTGKLPAD